MDKGATIVLVKDKVFSTFDLINAEWRCETSAYRRFEPLLLVFERDVRGLAFAHCYVYT